MDEKLRAVVAHVDQCSTCTAANKRVNDFCEEGKLLFFEYSKDKTPTSIKEHTLTQDQYDRLVAETQWRQRQGGRN